MLLRITFSLLITLLAADSVVAQRRPSAKRRPVLRPPATNVASKVPSIPPGLPVRITGEMRGSTYVNDFFRLTVAFPEGWQVDTPSRTDFQKDAQAMLEAKNPARQERLKRAASRLIVLFTTTRVEPPLSVASVFVGAEDLSHAPLIPTLEQYYAQVKLTQQLTTIPMRYSDNTQIENIGGERFIGADVVLGEVQAVKDFYARTMGIDISVFSDEQIAAMKIRSYFAIRNGYGLAITYTAFNPQLEPRVRELLKQIKFR